MTATSVYAASSSGQVLEAHDLTTGALQWTAATGPVTSSPAAVNGVVYLGTDDHRLLGFDASGATQCAGAPKTCTPLWSVSTGGAVRSSPVAADGTVYVGSDDHQLHAYSYPIGFTMSVLQGTSSSYPIVGRFGPDGRFYVLQQGGVIKAYTVSRSAPNNYNVTATETINLIDNIPNHDDDGTLNPSGAGSPPGWSSPEPPQPGDLRRLQRPAVRRRTPGTMNLDTNSGMVSQLTWNGTAWSKFDLVRGLPRSEENHWTNGLAINAAGTMLYVEQGGNTNMGAPSHVSPTCPSTRYQPPS